MGGFPKESSLFYHMKTSTIVGNWKANKTIKEVKEWIEEFSGAWKSGNRKHQDLEIALCPPFTLLYLLKLLISEFCLPIKLGAQDISPFPDGAYTGEISGRMLSDLAVNYVLVGHSERRRYFAETDIHSNGHKSKKVTDSSALAY